MIISLFGPDGVGKSTASRKLRKLGWCVFSGTDIASWPDRSWYDSFVARGTDEATLDDDAHFVEKIVRAHQLARRLEATNKYVVIDSDPLHKTLIHDYLRAMPNVEEARARMRARLAEFTHLTTSDTITQVHVCFQVSEQLSIQAQAKICFERSANRMVQAFFDPATITESRYRVEATAELKQLLIENSNHVLTVLTYTQFAAGAFTTAIEHISV